MNGTRHLDLEIYKVISKNTEGLSPAAIAARIHSDTYEVRRLLSSSPLLSELCYCNSKGCYSALINGSFPHYGLDHYAGYYSSVAAFLSISECEIFDRIEQRKTGKTPHTFLRTSDRKSMQLARCSMLGMFTDLNMTGVPAVRMEKWEIALYPEISVTGGAVRCSCDVLLITEHHVFAFNFLPSSHISEAQLMKLYELSGDFGLICGSDYRVVTSAVMTKGSGQFTCRELNPGKTGSDLRMWLCSRDMIYRVLNENTGLLKKLKQTTEEQKA